MKTQHTRKVICPECGAPCVMTGIGYSHEETPLQLAAPELLDASESVLDTLKSMVPNSMVEGMIMALESAIKKAKGE